MRLIRAVLTAFLLAGLAGTAALAQQGAEVAVAAPPDYAAWERTATKAEAQLQAVNSPDEDLTSMRRYLVEWRATFQAAQGVNQTRIDNLKPQIDALGPPPAEGAAEAIEITQRRNELNAQMSQLQAPGLAADEAYRRADGLIKETDRILRDRQAAEILQLWPSPLNPANWPAGAKAVTDAAFTLIAESKAQASRALPLRQLKGNLPLILAYTAIGLLLIGRGRQLMMRLYAFCERHSAARWQRIWGFVLSLGQVILPTVGAVLISKALKLSTMLGMSGLQIAEMLPGLIFAIFAAIWLGNRIFPKREEAGAPLTLPAEHRAEGRVYVGAFGLLLVFDAVRRALVGQDSVEQAATSVLTFPVLVVAGLLLFRIGQLLHIHVEHDTARGEAVSFRNRMIGFVARLVQLIGIGGPILAGIGYVSAAGAVIMPAAISLALIGLIFITQDLVDSIHALLTRRESDEDALVPTLIGFVLVVLSLPLFALIWGVRAADLGELWSQFMQGFSIGETRISPTAFMVFALVFGIGYTVTRLVQGALRSSILPKTKLDQGGKNAILAGLGYVGLFLSGLIAVNAAGINLAGLAIVAGALSVGIGFGLQNIVSNFVSGIILLIERPVSEGDWIEVGGVQGTVKAISVRSTRIQTFDRTDVIVPNSDLIAGRVTNWTRYNLTGRLIVPISVAYGADTRKVERILREIAEAEPLAVMNPAPLILFMGFSADAMLFEIRVILRDVNFQVTVRSQINHEIVRRFTEENIALSLSVGAQAQMGVPQDEP